MWLIRPSGSAELAFAPVAGSAVSARTEASAAGTTNRTRAFMYFPPLWARWLSASVIRDFTQEMKKVRLRLKRGATLSGNRQLGRHDHRGPPGFDRPG